MEFLSRFPALLTEESEMGNANILIIEDNEDIALQMKKYLIKFITVL